ncbi:CLUMA_CG004474, isoform A [Clunio marinus]|uniref:CLUMA_CG004474, isoform A n=1 Tax=Clunio marinus TaxID=568069 RepID=A0A1J1HW93_9DIPT|nr:CLUMA_CG004474, isoform A [Clunio marinus]
MKAIFFILLIAVVFISMEASAKHLVGDESMNLVSNHGMIEKREACRRRGDDSEDEDEDDDEDSDSDSDSSE